MNTIIFCSQRLKFIYPQNINGHLNCPVLTFNYSCRLQIKGGRYRNILIDITPYGLV